MPKLVTAVRLFLASPADVSEERAIVQNVVAELNRSIARALGVFVDLLRWEDVLPGMGRPQQIILDQADIDDTDVFVGILWNRFGTPSGKSHSGTEEEFDVAYRAWHAVGRPHILLFFCTRPASLNSEEELRQRSKVLVFKSKVENMGLVRSFETSSHFESLLRYDLSNFLLAHFSRPDVRATATDKAPDSAAASQFPTGEISKSALEAVAAGKKKMIRIPGGEFLGGQHSERKTLPEFWIDEAPVTNQEFWSFVLHSGYSLRHRHNKPEASSAFEHLQRDAEERPIIP